MDPEVRALEGGAKVARLRIATTERIYNRQTQETKEHTEWHNVTLWRNLADPLLQKMSLLKFLCREPVSATTFSTFFPENVKRSSSLLPK